MNFASSKNWTTRKKGRKEGQIREPELRQHIDQGQVRRLTTLCSAIGRCAAEAARIEPVAKSRWNKRNKSMGIVIVIKWRLNRGENALHARLPCFGVLNLLTMLLRVKLTSSTTCSSPVPATVYKW